MGVWQVVTAPAVPARVLMMLLSARVALLVSRCAVLAFLLLRVCLVQVVVVAPRWWWLFLVHFI